MADRRHNKRKLGKAQPRLRHGRSIIPTLFTVGNIVCGYYSVIATLRGDYDHAAIAIGLGSVLDGLDGRVARLMKTTSDFGVQLDSLADFGTFGFAPAMLAVNWGLTGIDSTDPSVQHWRSFAWLATFAFVMCGALRLARFNTQAQKPPETASKRYFVGLPIPPSALLIAALVHFWAHFFNEPLVRAGENLPKVFFIVVMVSAGLMISTIRYHSFKELDIMKRGVRFVLLAVGLLIGLIILYSEVVLLVMAVAYWASGPVGKIMQIMRRRAPAGATHHEPAHGNIKS